MSKLINAVFILIAANAVVFLWPNDVNNAPHLHKKRVEQNPHFVRLNKEIEERFYSENDAQLQAVTLPSDVSDVGVLTDLETTQDPVVIDNQFSDGVCYRLGPFMHKESYDLAQAVLFNAGVDFKKTTRISKESNVYRLFLGPYLTDKDVAAARRDLNQKLILDHFSRKLAEGEYIISLGIYSTQEAAEAALRLFQRQLERVQVQNETILLPDSYWLHFAMQKSSPKFLYLKDIDWGESSIKLGPYVCKT